MPRVSKRSGGSMLVDLYMPRSIHHPFHAKRMYMICSDVTFSTNRANMVVHFDGTVDKASSCSRKLGAALYRTSGS
ncbi:predicted protein [Botrytis cinerea T4]|uniref:Uncharacterized protein n=1 Tax=Botryotinia fuckeliana (strain T4) TaxID=999810 RepID=G2XVM2_BOTF4|nr:predicted protein [Botrytis cinerea T4]